MAAANIEVGKKQVHLGTKPVRRLETVHSGNERGNQSPKESGKRGETLDSAARQRTRKKGAFVCRWQKVD